MNYFLLKNEKTFLALIKEVLGTWKKFISSLIAIPRELIFRIKSVYWSIGYDIKNRKLKISMADKDLMKLAAYYKRMIYITNIIYGEPRKFTSGFLDRQYYSADFFWYVHSIEFRMGILSYTSLGYFLKRLYFFLEIIEKIGLSASLTEEMLPLEVESQILLFEVIKIETIRHYEKEVFKILFDKLKNDLFKN